MVPGFVTRVSSATTAVGSKVSSTVSPLKPSAPAVPIRPPIFSHILPKSGILTPEILPSSSVVVEPPITASKAGIPVLTATLVPSFSPIFKGVLAPASPYCAVNPPGL